MPTRSKPAPKQRTLRPAAKPTTQAGKPGKPTTKSRREKIYPKKELRDRGILYQYEACYGENAMRVEQTKALLDWTEVPSKEGSLFTDRYGKHIVCKNNTTNREIRWSKVEELVQIHLTRRYRFNGEDILIGEYGSVLNGQKSMIAHVLAEQDRLIDLEGPRKWVRYWDGPITMEKGVKFGISEDDDIVNTIDTAQPRTLKDVMYRSEYFKSMAPDMRSAASKAADYCLKLLWSRMGAGDMAFSPFATHDAVLDFLDRHPTILKAIQWAATKNHAKIEFPNADGKAVKRGRVDLIIEPSRAAALLYLMAAADTQSEVYRYAKPDPSENAANLDLWDKAEKFWNGLVDGDSQFEPVRLALGMLVNQNTAGKPSHDEKITVVWKAWQLFKEKRSIDPKSIRPRYLPRAQGEPLVLINEWDFGGVDIRRKLEREKDSGTPDPDDPKNNRDEDGDDDDHDDTGELPGLNGTIPGPSGVSADVQETDAAGNPILRDPTPAEIRAMLGKNQAMENETPEQERARRERVEAEAAAEKERAKEESRKRAKKAKT